MNRALAEAAEERVAEALPLQHELIGLPASDRGAALRAGRAGRPPGARNRRLEEAARLVVERFGDPLLHQVAVATMPLDELVAAGLSLEKAFEERRLAAAVVLPYLHQRQAVRVDVSTRQVVHLTIVEGAEEGQQYQEVVDAVVVQSDGPLSDDAVNPLALQAEASGAQLMRDQSREAGQPAASARATGEGGGPLFAPRALDHAPASVDFPSAGNFSAPIPDTTGPGRGE